jgi:hypothetical protein
LMQALQRVGPERHTSADFLELRGSLVDLDVDALLLERIAAVMPPMPPPTMITRMSLSSLVRRMRGLRHGEACGKRSARQPRCLRS